MKNSSRIPSFALLLAALSTAGCDAAPPAPAPITSTPPSLEYSLGDKGFATLALNGRSLLGYAWSGDLTMGGWMPKFRKADGTIYTNQDKPLSSQLDRATSTVVQTFSWGKLSCAYSQQGERLMMRFRVSNDTREPMIRPSVHLVELAFPEEPQARTLEAGMWGNGGQPREMHKYPLGSDGRNAPPVILASFSGGVFSFCSDDVKSGAGVSIPFSTNHPTDTMFPCIADFGADILPGQSRSATVSFRFAPVGTAPLETARDVIDSWVQAHPYQLKWSDHRPIGALFLATSQTHPETNPRGWFLNAKDVDVTTEAGLQKWRERLLKFADDSIKVLKDLGAQGMITWDPEGEEFASATYYGDPRLTAQHAPETEYSVDGKSKAIDEYFQKFRAAGLRVGVCLRPQQIVMTGDKPVQSPADDPVQTLRDKLAYAQKRWGCTLFYVDSTVDKKGALDAEVFKKLQEAFPDVLSMPENENLRDYAYSAPLNSFAHHGITSTPASVREVYPQAFSGLLASATPEKFAENHAALVDAVRHGDILIVNGWYGGQHIENVKNIYEEARTAR
jgi:hypothetical protein